MPSFRLTKDMPIATATVLDGSQFVAAAPIATVLDAQQAESPLVEDLCASYIEYVRGDGTTFRVAATDAVIQVFAIDAERFAMANEAKRRVHVCAGRPGYLNGAFGPHGELGPILCTVPWCLHAVIAAPCFWMGPMAFNAWARPHVDAPFPARASRALIVTEHGVVGDGEATGRGTQAIAWDGFDVDKVHITRYDDAREPRCTRATTARACGERGVFADPLSWAVGFGVLFPCCAYTCVQPNAPGLYRVEITSTHKTVTGTGKRRRARPTAAIDLFALAGSPDAVVAALRRGAASARAPSAATMHDRD